MQDAGLLEEAKFQRILERVDQVVDDSVEFSEQSPQPALDTLMDHITKEPARG